MTASVRRPSLRLHLALGTALAGGTLAMAPVARAQTLPSGGTVIVPAAGTVTVDGGLPGGTISPAAGASTLDIGLIAPATVINWTSFDVVGTSAATPATVNFSAALTGSVVVNRVTTNTASTIGNGQITTYATLGDATTKQNTAVWLLNPAGVLIGGGGAIDAGAFMGSTLDVCAAAACTAGEVTALTTALTTGPSVRLFGAATSATAVSVRNTARIVTGDTLVLVGGAVEVQPGTALDAGGDIHLVAATDVQVRRPGSPLILQINRGSQVAGTLVSTGGTITGDSVVVAAARPDGLAEALLGIGGTITARGVATGARGVVLLGGNTQPVIAIAGDPRTAPSDAAIAVAAGQGGAVGITSTATLDTTTLGTANLDVIVNGTGAVTVGGPVLARRDYRVTGGSVALGAAATIVAQSAGREVSVRATGGDLTGLGSLTLRSNRAGATGGALTLASAGAIGFGVDTLVIGGDGTPAGAADIRVAEAATATTTSFGTLSGRSLGRIPGAAETAPLPLTLYGATTFGTVTLDRALDLTVLDGGAVVGTLTAASITTGVNGTADGSGVALADDLRLIAAGSMRLGSGESRTGSVSVTARDGDVTGLAAGTGFGGTTLTAALGQAAATGVLGVTDGNVGVYAGRSTTGALTATGTNGRVQLAAATAGNDVTLLAQKIDATTVQAAAVSTTPLAAGLASGTATLHAYAHDATAGAVDLRVGSVSAGTDVAARLGLDVLLTADAAGGTIAAGALAADRDVTVVGGNGASAATISGEVRAGRRVTTGAYAVTAGGVTLGDAATTVGQSAAAAVTVRSTATDITGLGTLTLQSNRDGIGTEALTLDSARAIAFDMASRLFAGNGTAAGNSDLLVRESATATATSFGQVRAGRLDQLGGGPLVLYGATTFGTVDLDRSLTLTIANGGGGAAGTLTTAAMTLGVNPFDGGSGTAIADSLFLTTVRDARFASVTSRTGSLSITAIDGDVTGRANAGGFDRVSLSAARADATATPRIADGGITILAGRNSGGAQTATGTNGLALLGDVIGGGAVRVDAQAIDAVLARSDSASVSLTARAVDGFVPGAAPQALTLGTAVAGLAATLAADAGGVRVGTVDAGRIAAAGSTTGTVDIQAYGDARIGVAAPTTLVPGGISTRIGNVTVRSLHGDITGGEATASFGRADLATLDGSVAVVADAQALGATQVGLIQLGTVFAGTSEAQIGATVGPARGNITATGRVVDVLRAETSGAIAGAGGSLYLQARAGTATSDVHVALGTGLIGTTAMLVAGTGSLGTATDPNGGVFVGSLEAGRNRLVGTGTALPGTITIDAVNTARADTLASRTGSVLVTASTGDVSGYLGASGRPAITAALADTGGGDNRAIVDGLVTIRATSTLANRGIASLGPTRAGGDVLVEARAIDAAAQTVRSDRGSVTLSALSGDLTVGSAAAGIDVLLDASADTLSARGPGSVTAGFLGADRNVGVDADATATITDDVTAGLGGVSGYYHVTARGNVVLGGDATAGALADPDLQSALDDIGITATGNITAARRLTLRSNSAGVTDGTGDADGVRELVLDAGGTIALALPEGLSVTDRDAVATRLIGGSAAAPRQSAVRVRAGAGTTLTLGLVSARALRSIGATPVATDYPAFAARAGANPLQHDGDIRIGSVDVAESLGIFASGAANRLLQIDGARSRGGNVELVASGELRGYQLTAPGGATPLGVYVGSGATAADRVDVYARSTLLDDVVAGSFAAIETFGGRLRVDTVATGTTRPIAQSGISLLARTDLRLTSAVAARGDVVATATTGSITGLASPDNGSAPTPFAPVTLVQATDGNLTVGALGAGTGAGLVAATALLANSGEVPGAGAPLRGNVSVTGQQIGLGTATAALGGLTLYARPGSAAPVATGILLVTGTAGTTAGITVDAGGISAPSQANGSAVIGTLTAGTNALSGAATITTAGNIRAGTVESRTGAVTLTARDADVTGLDDGTGTYGRANLTAATARAAVGVTPAVADGSVAVYAGRDATGALTATGINGLARLGSVTAGGDVTVLAQTIDAGTVQAAAVSANPLVAGAASGTATLHAYAHGAVPGAVDLSVGTVSAGTGSAPRRGLDVVLIADAADATLLATTVNADRNASALAGSGPNGQATLAGEVRAGRSDPAGAYAVSAGGVTLGTATVAIEQSARGAVTITSTATDITGLGTLTLQANSDGPGREPLTLRAARGIVLPAASRLFGGIDTAADNSDILVAEGAGATLNTFGQVRGRSLGGIPVGAATAPVPLTLYGPTTFGTVDLDRSLALTVRDGGGGGAIGTLVTGPLTVGRYPVGGVADTVTITTAGTARFASIANRTGGIVVTGGQGIVADGAIDAVDAILLGAARDVTTTTVTSTAGRVAIGATAGNASGERVTAAGAIAITAGGRAGYTTLGARDAITVQAGTIGVGTATAGTSLAMTAIGADGGTADGEALVLGTGDAGTTASLIATTGSVRATTLDAGRLRNGRRDDLSVTAARDVRLTTARSATGNATVTARDGTVFATTLTAAIGTVAQGADAAIADGNVAVYAGRDAGGALTATGGNGLARLGTVSAGGDVMIFAQKIDAGTVQAAAISGSPTGGGAAIGTATLIAYAHDTTSDAIDLRVGTASAGTGSANRRGQDVVLTASAAGGTLAATTLDADRNVAVLAGSGTNGAAAVSGALRAGRVDAAGTYAVRAGRVTLGTAGQTIGQGATAATTVTATAGGVTGLGALTLQSNRDGVGTEALEVRATGGGVVFDPASTLRGGGSTAGGSNVTIAATGVGANVDVGTLVAVAAAASLQAEGSLTTRGPLTAATATLQAGGGITVNGPLAAATATLRAIGRVTTTAPITATTLTVQSSQVSFGDTLSATTLGLYNQSTTANRTRLGGTASATETAFEVDQGEFNRITATTLLIGSGADDASGQPLNAAWLRQDTDIAALTIAAGTGSSAIRVLGAGAGNAITVTGAVQTGGGTASRVQNTRVLQLGGAAASTTGQIGQIRIVNDGAATGSAGSIATGGGVLDLRAALILAGKQAYIDEVTRAGVDVARTFISNPNSSLYGAGSNGYLVTGTPIELITTGQLKLQFGNFALFQNTSRPGAIPTGVTITGASSSAAEGQPLVLRSGSTSLANGFALFGRFQPSATEAFFSTQAALLGSSFISNGATSSNGVNPVSARLNGCLLSSASGGCLASSIAQPTLNVFDVTRDQVLRGSDDLVVTFDPLVGSNNEALFGDIASGDFDLQPCPDGTTSAQCTPTGDAKP